MQMRRAALHHLCAAARNFHEVCLSSLWLAPLLLASAEHGSTQTSKREASSTLAPLFDLGAPAFRIASNVHSHDVEELCLASVRVAPLHLASGMHRGIANLVSR